MVHSFNIILVVFLTYLGLGYGATVVTNNPNNVTTVVINGSRNVTDSSTAQSLVVSSNETVTKINLVINSNIGVNSSLNDMNNTINGKLTNDELYGNLSWTNLTHHAFDNFPADIMPEWMRNNGGVILHIFILAYCCLGLGIVCDLYFLPALDLISQILSLPPDIAGATFMAIGTSAPELFTSIIGVFVSQDDIGVGTILGTAVFNLIVIPAACGFAVMAFCPKTPNISRFPILRDSIFYILTIITLILCIKDNMVDWVESLILISLFVVYLVIMYFNALYSTKIKQTMAQDDEEEEDENTPLVKPLDHAKRDPLEKSHQEWNTFSTSMRSTASEFKRARSGSMKRIVFADVDVEDETDWIESNTFCKYFLFPMTLLFKITLPKATKCSFMFTFTISVVWIGALTYVCVWMVTIIGFTFGLPDTVSGLTLLAAGTSVPELISSVLVVKKASQADMAICNSIGSNIFDILFCLGVPWLLKSIIWCFQKGTFDLEATAVPIDSAALPLTTFSLLVTIFALIITFNLTDWKLGFSVGITCSIIYIIFVIVASTLEIGLG